jgi:hypothetical protein
MENLSPLPIPDLDRTFSVETSEEVKQPKKENESPKMLDSNNNSPNVLSTNLPVPTMRVLPSTPNKEIFPPGTPRFRAKQETKGGIHWFSVLYQIVNVSTRNGEKSCTETVVLNAYAHAFFSIFLVKSTH